MNLHKAYQSGSTRALLKALSPRLKHDQGKSEGGAPYCEEDTIEDMIKKHENVEELIKKLNLSTWLTNS